MPTTATLASKTRLPCPAILPRVPATPPVVRGDMAALLSQLERAGPVTRKLLRAGDTLYRAGESFGDLYILNSGFCKMVNLARDGREQVVALKLRGDWMGFDGIASGRYGCDAVAMDTGEVWIIRYEALLAAAVTWPALLRSLHEAMSLEISRDRHSMMSLCTLPADARVAQFLRDWVHALDKRGMRSDQITLRMTRAEIGNYLGMTLESVSRALSKLARVHLIRFSEKGRRNVHIPDADALTAFVQQTLSPAPSMLH